MDKAPHQQLAPRRAHGQPHREARRRSISLDSADRSMKATNIIAARMDRTTKMVPRTLCLAISRPQRQPITISTAQARGKLQGGLLNMRRRTGIIL